MVVDRGGLRYPIEVVDLFSKNLQAFRAEIRLAREELAKLKRTAGPATTRVAKRQLQASKETAKASREEANAARDRAQQVAAGARQQKQVQDLRSKMFRNERIERERTKKATDRAAASRARANRQALRASDRATASQARLGKSVKQVDSSAQKLLFTFRRLVGVLALFTVARQVSAAFANLVRVGFEFNQTVERSRLGIAGIIVAVANVRDEQGKLLKGAEAFVAAQGEARKQQQLLRQDALSTVATFQELLDAFQIALGPGLAAGFNLDQVRQFSVLISQAASNIGLPQRQLSEEIRAILTGNIRQTTTRIAQVLNLTNQEIRKMKALGADVFFKELQDRLQGFALGAKAAATTVGGLFVRLKDVIELVAGTAAKGAFDTLQNVLQGLFDALTVVSKTDVGSLLKPDPAAQKAFEAIFTAIENILLRIEDVGKGIGLGGLTNSAQLFAGVLQTVGILIVDILGGAIQGFATLKKVLDPIVSAFRGLASVLPESFASELLLRLTQVVTVLFSLKIGFLILGGTIGKAVKFLWAMPAALRATWIALNLNIASMIIFVRESKVAAFLMRAIRSDVAIMAGIFTLLVTAMALVSGALLDIDVQLQDLPALFGLMFEQVFTQIIAFGELVFTTMKVRATQAFNFIVSKAGQALADLKALFDLELGASEEDKIGRKRQRDFDREKRKLKLKQANEALELAITEQKEIQARQDSDAAKKAGDRINALKKAIAKRKGEADETERLLAAERARRTAGEGGVVTPKPVKIEPEEIAAIDKARQRLRIRRAELDARSAIQALDKDLKGPERSLQIAQIKLVALERQLAITKDFNQQELKRLTAELGISKDAKKEAVQVEINNLLEKQSQLEDEILLKIQLQIAERERQRLIQEGSFEGLSEGFLNFANQFESSYLAAVHIAQTATQQLADFISTVISDAFDPNKDATIKQRFGEFLQSIANMIIQTLVRVAIAKAILGLSSLFGGGGDGFEDITHQFVGRRKGGRIPGRRSQASLAHYTHPQGLAAGGAPVPPKGISRKDTTPIWAQPGEYMMRLSAVQKYGIGIMESLNQGLIDPGALASMAGSRRLSRNTRRKVGYQTGGQVSTGASKAAAASPAASAGGGGGLGAALLIANDTTAERLLAGGSKAVLDYIDEHGADIEGRLSRFRS